MPTAALSLAVMAYTLCPSFTDTPLARGDITVDEAGNVLRGDGGWDDTAKTMMTKAIGGILTVDDQVRP